MKLPLIYWVLFVAIVFFQCKSGKHSFFDLRIVSYVPVCEENAVPKYDVLHSLIMGFEDIDSNSVYIPRVFIKRAGVKSEMELITKIGAGFAGNLGNISYVDRKIGEQYSEKICTKELWTDNGIPGDSLKWYFSSAIKDSSKIFFVFSEEINTGYYSDINKLRDAIFEQLRTKPNSKIWVHFLPPTMPTSEEEEESVVINNLEDIKRSNEALKNLLDAKEKRRKLEELHGQIVKLAEADPLNVSIWFEACLNRIYVNDLNKALNYLRSAASAAIKNGVNVDFLNHLEVTKTTLLQPLAVNKSIHFQAILKALQQNNANLISIIKNVLMKEGNAYILYMDPSTVYTRPSGHRYRIAVDEKSTDGSIGIRVYLDCGIREQEIPASLKIGQAIDGEHCDRRWDINVVNESSLDNDYIKLRLNLSYDENRMVPLR